MEINVTTKVVSGAERGGENLFLRIQATNEDIKDRRLIAKLNNLDEPIEEFIKSITCKMTKNDILEALPHGVLASDGKDVFCQPTEYDFKVDMTVEEFTNLVKKYLSAKTNTDWVYSRGLNMSWFEWSYTKDHFVGGNAE